MEKKKDQFSFESLKSVFMKKRPKREEDDVVDQEQEDPFSMTMLDKKQPSNDAMQVIEFKNNGNECLKND